MENQSSYNLDQAIAAWRAEIIQSRGLAPEQIRELEIHVRDSYEALSTSGLTHEERFLIATRRLGPANALEEEFQKLPSRLTSRPTRTTRFLVWATAVGSLAVLALGESLSALRRGYTMQFSEPGSSSFSQTLLTIFANPGWLFSLLAWAALAGITIWAYLRARRPVVRYGIIAFALLVPFLLSLPQFRMIGHFFSFLAQGPVWWIEMFTGTPVDIRFRRNPISSGPYPGVFAAWWLTIWMLLACREVFLRLQDGVNFGFRSVKDKICRALDAE